MLSSFKSVSIYSITSYIYYISIVETVGAVCTVNNNDYSLLFKHLQMFAGVFIIDALTDIYNAFLFPDILLTEEQRTS